MQALPPPERRTVSVEDAAQILGIGRTTAYKMVRRGEIPALRFGTRVVISREVLDRLLAGEAPPPRPRPSAA